MTASRCRTCGFTHEETDCPRWPARETTTLDLDLFTATELRELHHHTYTWANRLYGRCNELLDTARVMPAPWAAEYRAVMAAHKSAHAAATEQYELLIEVGAEIRRRAAVHA